MKTHAKFILALIMTALLSGCGNGQTQEQSGTSAVSDISEEITLSETESVTLQQTEQQAAPSEEFSEQPVSIDDPDEISQTFYYAKYGYLNDEHCIVEDDSVTVSWEGDEGRKYSAELMNSEYDTVSECETEQNSCTFSGLEQDMLYIVQINDITDISDEYPNGRYVTSKYICLSDVGDCPEIKIAAHDDEKYVFTWEPAENADLYLVCREELGGKYEFCKAVGSPTVFMEGLCAGQKSGIIVVPAKYGPDGGSLICGRLNSLEYVPESEKCPARAEYVSGSEEVELEGRTIYSYEYEYPVIELADRDAAERINSVISERTRVSYDAEQLRADARELAGSAFEYDVSYDTVNIALIGNRDRLLSFRDYGDTYSAGAMHGMYGVTYLHFDPATGDRVLFNDIFDRQKLYAALRDEMKAQLFDDEDHSEYYEEQLDEAMTTGSQSEFYDLMTDYLDNHWYFENGKLYITFDVYMMGSYAEGIKYAEFDYDDISGFIIDKDILL